MEEAWGEALCEGCGEEGGGEEELREGEGGGGEEGRNGSGVRRGWIRGGREGFGSS